MRISFFSILLILYFTGLHAGCCIATVTDSGSYMQTQNPVVTIMPALQVVQNGQAVVLTVSYAGTSSPYTYAWTGPHGFTATTEIVSIEPALAVNSGIYTVTVTDAAGCSTSAQAEVTVVPVLTLPTCSVVHTAKPVITGASDPFCQVAILINGTIVGTAFADEVGNFTPDPLPNGLYIIHASCAVNSANVLSDPVKVFVDTRIHVSMLSRAMTNKFYFRVTGNNV